MAIIKSFAKIGGGLLGSVFGGPLGAAAAFGLAGAGAKMLGGKKKQPIQRMGTPTRDDAAALLAADDELRRRKGGAADILNGTTGVEAAVSGGKFVLGN